MRASRLDHLSGPPGEGRRICVTYSNAPPLGTVPVWADLSKDLLGSRQERGSKVPTAYSSRLTVSGEKAGRHTAMYSAPSASGVLYRTHSPAIATMA